MLKKVAVILSGSGFMDGSEIQESVLTLYGIELAGGEYRCFAPDIDHHHINNHLTGEEIEGETRNVLVESARIARGNIKPLSEFNADDFDAMILPGGYGAALNLCDFAVVGPQCEVNSEVEKAVMDIHNAGKPIGFLCIAPVIAAKLIDGVKITIGNDEPTEMAVTVMGANHIDASPTEVIIDKENKIVTSPCYMYDSSVSNVFVGATNVAKEVLKMAKKN